MTTRAPSVVVARLEAHLGSKDVARVIYGAIVGLALVVALQGHPPGAGTMAGLLVATAIAIGLAELYSEAVSLEARSRKPLGRRQLKAIAEESVAVVFGAAFPAAFFALSALGAFSLDLAFTLSKWTGLALICAYGYLAGRLAGGTVPRCLAHAAALGVLGGLLIAVKAVLH
jgi:uncharacterized membrane protein